VLPYRARPPASAILSPTSSILDRLGPSRSHVAAQRRGVNCAAPKVSTLDEGRRDPRSHLFVAATLYSDAGSAAVRIRNMSQSGALIETPVIPDPGTAVVLKRGSLQAPGRIAWRVEGKAGIAFSGRVNVGDWLSRQVRGHQEQVDEIISGLRSGKQARSAAGGADMASDPSIDAELQALRADLVRLGDGLASDAILVATHPEVQLIDIALQRVDRLIGQLRA